MRANKKVICGKIKSVESLNDIHLAQVLTYMKLSDCRLGYLINFNVQYLKKWYKKSCTWKFIKSIVPL
jgi:GxxExxY protein